MKTTEMKRLELAVLRLQETILAADEAQGKAEASRYEWLDDLTNAKAMRAKMWEASAVQGLAWLELREARKEWHRNLWLLAQRKEEV